MNPDVHERACHLIDAEYVEGLSDSERAWLDAHLAECPACQGRAGASQRALQALRSNTLSIDPAVISLTQARVQLRARELRENQVRLRALYISCGLSWLLGTFTAPLLWQAITWLGRYFEVSKVAWFMAFAICWLAPATLVGAAMVWRQSRASRTIVHPEAWER